MTTENMTEIRQITRKRAARGQRGLLRPLGPLGLLGVLGLLGLLGCSDDPEPEWATVNIEVQSCSTAFEEEGGTGDTRAWTPPSPYVTYGDIYGSNGMFAPQKNMVNRSINVFFTKDGETPLNGTLFYKASGNTPYWHLGNMEIERSGNYQLYGYIPEEAAISSRIEGNSSFADGAVLYINGLSAVTPDDVCFIVGAKEYHPNDESASYTVEGLVPGKFDVNFNSGKNAENHIFLLFDHLYSSLRFSFKVDPVYDALRTIKLRKLELKACANDDEDGIPATYNAVVKLKKYNTGESPVESVSFVPEGTTRVSYTILFDLEKSGSIPLTLSTTPSSFLGSFVPGANNYFLLRTTYDVYDKEGNLIRSKCVAENKIDLRKRFGSYMETVRGRCYSYTITVQPTYLYMLSEPDMDNPTITLK